MMEFLILAAILGCIVGAIASSKGRSFGAWWLYGTLLFIVAIIHVLVVSPLPKAQEEKLLRDMDGKKCPRCAEVIKSEALVCKHCGHEFDSAPA